MSRLAWPRRLFRAERGAASIELALVLPLLLTLVSGSVELVSYMLAHHKLERTAAALSDLVARSARITEGEVEGILDAAEQIMLPFNLESGGTVTVSSISAHDGKPARIDWQRSHGGSNADSAVGTEGGAASLPAGFIVRDGDNVIVSEAWLVYQPALLGVLVGERTLYRLALCRPRFGRLDVIHP